MTDINKLWGSAPAPSSKPASKPAPAATAAPVVKPPPTNPMDTVDGNVQSLWGGKAITTPPIVPALKPVVTTIGKALDAQGYAVRKRMTHETDTDKQMTKIRHAIPGADWLYTARAPNTGIPFLDHIQDVANHASQGIMDAAIQQVLDPVTYETAGLGLARDAGLLKPVAKIAMRAINSNAISRTVYDALHWGGKVAREQGPEVAQTVRGASNRASAIGARVEQHVNERVANIIDGKPIKNVVTGKVTPGVKLDDAERLQVGKALNGEVEVEALSPKELAAYKQLRTLTNLDYHLRRQTAQTIAVNHAAKGLSPEDRAVLDRAFASGHEPEVPVPGKRVRTFYGEPQPRSRVVPGEPAEPPAPPKQEHQFPDGVTPEVAQQTAQEYRGHARDFRAQSEQYHAYANELNLLDKMEFKPTQAAIDKHARELRDQHNFEFDPLGHQAKLKGKKFRPGWVYRNNKWVLTGEWEDVPKRFIDTTSKPKHKPYSLEDATKESSIDENPEDYGFKSGDEMRAFLVELNRRERKTLADYSDAARKHAVMDMVFARGKPMREAFGMVQPDEALSDAVTRLRGEAARHHNNALEASAEAKRYETPTEPAARAEAPAPPFVGKKPKDPLDAWDRITEAMSPDDKALLGKSLTQPHVFQSLPDDLKAKAQALKDSLEAKYYPNAGAKVKPLEPQQRYKFKPENADEIERATKLRELYRDIDARVEKAVPRRESYMPFTHYGKAKDAGTEAFKVNPSEYFDPRNKQREDLKVESPAQLQHGFDAMASNTNRQVTTKAIHDSLGELLDNPEINKLFEETIKATGSARTDLDKFKDAWKSVVGYPRAAVVSFTPRHAANILDLLANTVPAHQLPQAMGETMALAGKLMRATPKEYYALTKEGRDLGALSGNYVERNAFFQKFPEWMPGVGGKSTGPLGAWTRLNNKLVWAIDEAAKQTYGKMISKSGEAEGLRAGALASERLVDYEHVSPLQKFLRYVAPFGTFRGAIPGAVLGGVVRNPARAAFLNRATGGTFYGDQPRSGQPGIGLSLPTAEIGRAISYTPGAGKTIKVQERNLVSGPGNFLRGTIGAPFQAAAGLAQDVLAPSSKPSHWAMYGEPWLPKRDKHGKLDLGFLLQSASAGIPEAEALASYLGVSHFQWRGLPNEAARQTFGVNITPSKTALPAPPQVPSPAPAASGSDDIKSLWK